MTRGYLTHRFEVPKSVLSNHPSPEADEVDQLMTRQQNEDVLLEEHSEKAVIEHQISANSSSNCSFSSFDSTLHDPSSASSWTDDDCEQNATLGVQQMYDEFTDALYDDNPDFLTDYHFLSECHLWKSSFPHLRVVGKQICGNNEDSFFKDLDDVSIPSSSNYGEDSGESSEEASKFLSFLIQGVSLKLNENVDEINDGPDEEIIEQDGIYEEFIALDRSSDTDTVCKTVNTQHLTDKILSELISRIWDDVCDKITPLITKYMEFVLADVVSCDISYTHKGLVSAKQREPEAISSPQTDLPCDDLRGVLQVSSKVLVNRDVPKVRISSSKPTPKINSNNKNSNNIIGQSNRNSRRSSSVTTKLAPIQRSPNRTLAQMSSVSIQDELFSHEDLNKRTKSVPQLQLSPTWGYQFTLPPIDSSADANLSQASRIRSQQISSPRVSSAFVGLSNVSNRSQKESAVPSRVTLDYNSAIKGSKFNEMDEETLRELNGGRQSTSRQRRGSRIQELSYNSGIPFRSATLGSRKDKSSSWEHPSSAHLFWHNSFRPGAFLERTFNR